MADAKASANCLFESRIPAFPGLLGGSCLPDPMIRPILKGRHVHSSRRPVPDRSGSRDTRFNSQNYPIVTSRLQPETFKSAMADRAHAKLEFGAEAGQFASK